MHALLSKCAIGEILKNKFAKSMFKLSLGHNKFLLFPEQKCILYFSANYKVDRPARESYVNLDIIVASVLTNTRKSSTENGHFGRDKVTSHFLYGDNIDPGGIS